MPLFLKNILNQQTIAAIDLGSNALRAIIVRRQGNHLQVIKNFREALRLGEDVFSKGVISEEKMDDTEDAFIKLLHIFAAHNVSDVRAMATSAMRDSKNGPELAKRILLSTGIHIETIHGHEEARLIFEAVKKRIHFEKKTAVIMDVGGGSTEIIVVRDGHILGIKSFNVGTVRLLGYQNQEELEKKISSAVKDIFEFIRLHIPKRPDLFIGTGGNLRRIGKIRRKILRRDSAEVATFDEIHHMEEAILSMSYVDRIRSLELDQNRADVILPAIMLTHHLMQKLKVDRINLPKVGLKEGIILSMVRP
jgi:exopolyphosphatase / guanosine-5'-triphosphate,3'-diphosphate pyrophosphatase